METQENKLEDGIYFDLPAEEYQAAEALSNSGIKKLRVSPAVYWWNSPMNPAHEGGKKTAALTRGTMRHKFALEEDAFFLDYCIKPDASDYPDALETTEDIKAFMRENEIKPMTGKKIDLMDRIRQAGFGEDKVQFMDEIMDRADDERGQREWVTKEQVDDLGFASRMLSPAREYLSDGFPEVSVFWTDATSGVQLKARFDYIKPGLISDLKIFANAMEFPIDEAVRRELDGRRMNLQAFMYLAAWEKARELLKEKKVFGLPSGDGELEKVEQIFFGKSPDFSFVFQLGDAPYETRVRHFRQRADRDTSENIYWSNARRALRSAVDEFKRYKDHFGRDAWVSLDSIEKDITDDDMKWTVWDDSMV